MRNESASYPSFKPEQRCTNKQTKALGALDGTLATSASSALDPAAVRGSGGGGDGITTPPPAGRSCGDPLQGRSEPRSKVVRRLRPWPAAPARQRPAGAIGLLPENVLMVPLKLSLPAVLSLSRAPPGRALWALGYQRILAPAAAWGQRSCQVAGNAVLLLAAYTAGRCGAGERPTAQAIASSRGGQRARLLAGLMGGSMRRLGRLAGGKHWLCCGVLGRMLRRCECAPCRMTLKPPS